MRRLVPVLLFVAIAMPAGAQILSRPTDPPIVTATDESWYQLREPVQFAGELYYPAGAAVFFNGNSMVRTGHYNGVPLYVETTVEPYSVILVPIGGGQMQPYERLRRGELAGTSGSRPSSFPGRAVPDGAVVRTAPSAPTGAPTVPGAIRVYTPAAPVAVAVAAAPAPAPREVVGTAGVIVRPVAPTLGSLASIRRPESNDGIWIAFGGERWVSAGRAVRMLPEQFRIVGEYAGAPVFARREFQEDVIYLLTQTGLVAPYRLKQ